MSVKVEKIGKNKAKLTIEIDNAEFLIAEDRAFNKEKGKLSAPGFRKGKVTKDMAFKVYGRNAFLEETVNQCINATYFRECKDASVKPLCQPKINVVQADPTKNFIYEAEIAIIPEFKLGKYKGVKLEKTNIVISDDDVNKRIEEDREKNARIVSVNRKSKNGDIISLDFEGFVDGKPFKGGKAEKYSLTLGSKSFIDNFEDQLCDKDVGENIDVNVKFPENYQEKSLAGKPALFKCKINEIKEKQLPELNDEFASEVSEFETLADYKAVIRKNLTELREKQMKEQDSGKILEMIASETPMELASEAIDSQVDETIYNYANRMRYQGIEFEKYLEMIGKSLDDFKKEQRPIAERNLKNSIILEEIAKVEKIEATDEMCNEELEKMAKSYGMEVTQFKKSYNNPEDMKRLKDDLLYPAVMDWLYKNADLK